VVEEPRTPPGEERLEVEEAPTPPVEEPLAVETQDPIVEPTDIPVVEGAQGRLVPEEPPLIELERGVEIPDVADTSRSGGDAGSTPSRDMGSGPATVDSPSGVQLQVLEPEPASTKPKPRSGVPLAALQSQLTELLAELDDFRVDRLDGSAVDLGSNADPSANGSIDGFTHEARGRG
jgi:hypothetical protein